MQPRFLVLASLAPTIAAAVEPSMELRVQAGAHRPLADTEIWEHHFGKPIWRSYPQIGLGVTGIPFAGAGGSVGLGLSGSYTTQTGDNAPTPVADSLFEQEVPGNQATVELWAAGAHLLYRTPPLFEFTLALTAGGGVEWLKAWTTLTPQGGEATRMERNKPFVRGQVALDWFATRYLPADALGISAVSLSVFGQYHRDLSGASPSTTGWLAGVGSTFLFTE